VSGSGTLEHDGVVTGQAFRWKMNTSAEGTSTVTLKLVRGEAPVGVYLGRLASEDTPADDAAFTALTHVEVCFVCARDPNQYTVMGSHAALSDGLRLHPVEDALTTRLRDLKLTVDHLQQQQQQQQRSGVSSVVVTVPHFYYDHPSYWCYSFVIHLAFDLPTGAEGTRANAHTPISPTGVSNNTNLHAGNTTEGG
jgi:hypothetical protein